MNIMIDEFGRPILLLQDQDKKKRVKGLEAYKVKLNCLYSLTFWQQDQLHLSLKPHSDLKEWTKCLFHQMEMFA